MGQSFYSKSDTTEFFPTKDYVRDLLYDMMDSKVETILDPCAGDCGLEKFGKYEYYLMDINKRNDNIDEVGDFLKKVPDKRYDAVVVNPPFGLTVEFVNQCFKYSDDVYLIAPNKTVFKHFGADIVDCVLDWTISNSFGILTSIGCFHLHKTFGYRSYEDCLKKYFLPKAEHTFADAFKPERSLSEDRPFIVNRLTKARVIRNEQLIKDDDIYEAGDESCFTAKSATVNSAAGDALTRNIMYFDSIEDAKKFQQKYIDQADYVRKYGYEWGNNLLLTDRIPLI